MNIVTKRIIVAALAACVWMLATVFGGWGFDPASWDVASRVSWVLIGSWLVATSVFLLAGQQQ